MKRTLAGWTTAVAATALMALPAATFAQTPADRPAPTEDRSTHTPPEAGPATPQAQQPQPQTQAPPPQTGATEPQPGTQTAATSEVKRHLVAARTSLAELTQMPAAAQLAGETRNQVAQLISNFNELISANTNWRAAYEKVETNLDTLIGEDAGAAGAAQTGTPGAVGTSGTEGLDPAIRAKLMEVRRHLNEFEEAASAATPGAAGTTGTPSGMSGTAGTATPGTGGSTMGSQPQATPPGQQGAAQHSEAQHAEAMRHIAAIESILRGGAEPAAAAEAGAGTAAGAPTAGAATNLDREDIDRIQQHLDELRAALSNSNR